MIVVTILHGETEAKEDCILAGVPRPGDIIRLNSMRPTEKSLVVDQVTWVQGGNGKATEPDVIVSVHTWREK